MNQAGYCPKQWELSAPSSAGDVGPRMSQHAVPRGAEMEHLAFGQGRWDVPWEAVEIH